MVINWWSTSKPIRLLPDFFCLQQMRPTAHVQQQGCLQQRFSWNVHSLEQAFVIPFSSYLFNIPSHSCIPSPECSQNRIVPATTDLQQSSGSTAWLLTKSWSTFGRALSKCLHGTPGALTTDLETSALPGHPHRGHPSASLSPNWTNPKSLAAPHRTCLLSYLYWSMEFPLHFHTHSLSLERDSGHLWIFHLPLRSKDAVLWCGCAESSHECNGS